MSVAGGLHAAERQVDFRADGGSIDVGNSGIQIADRGKRLVHILRVDRRRKPVLDVIRDLDGIRHVVAGDDRNHRPENFFLRDAHLGIDVDEHGRFQEPAVLVFALIQTIAAANHLGAFGLGDFDVAQVSLELVLVHRRAHLNRLVEPITDLDLLRARHKVLDKLPVYALLHDDAAGRGAALSGGTERAPESALNGQFEVGVIEHDHGILAAEFERAVLEALGRGRAHNLADRRGTGQRNGANRRVLGERRAHFGPESGDDVDDALGYARIGQRLHQVESGKRSVLRGLDDAGVAADDRRQQLPRRNGHREIPRRDHAAHADRLPHGHGKLVGQLRRHGRTEQTAAFAGVVVGGVNRFLHIAACFFQDLAHLASHVTSVIFLTLDQDLGGAEYHLRAAGRRHQPPLGEGALGGIHGGIHIGLVRALENCDDFARIGRIAVFKRVAADGLDPLAINKILANPRFGRAAQYCRAGQGIGRHKCLLGIVQILHANNRGRDGQASRLLGSGSV